VILITIFVFILSFSLPFIKQSINSIIFRRICGISFIYAGVLIINTFNIQLIGSGIGLYNNFFQINIMTSLISIFILLISSIIILIWPITESILLPLPIIKNIRTFEKLINKELNYSNKKTIDAIELNFKNNACILLENNTSKSNDYCLIILFSILGAILLISSFDLISMYLSIELQSFSLYILSCIYKDKKSATSAGLKYFLLGGLSSCIILLGCGLMYTYTGVTNFEILNSIMSVYFNNTNFLGIEEGSVYSDILNSDNLDTIYLISEIKGISIGIIIIFSGFLFKIAASPFHNWAPA
jgi:NADH-ubiquinone oxidoreductase chain 2